MDGWVCKIRRKKSKCSWCTLFLLSSDCNIHHKIFHREKAYGSSKQKGKWSICCWLPTLVSQAGQQAQLILLESMAQTGQKHGNQSFRPKNMEYRKKLLQITLFFLLSLLQLVYIIFCERNTDTDKQAFSLKMQSQPKGKKVSVMPCQCVNISGPDFRYWCMY